ncbi:hypothetical protein [Pseudoxanthomonas indica]|uniref:Lipoprotein n=1 Tax=Pseudoxanthomonas indica TaxID=428993 RepID=A0A1T5LWH2_9GAMM|nr:hypothetical protein [Pseudoxanthomonas indica]GGD40918.1 hypothetical protein GCM10007235_11170 [Pseudoxanthomonas indica]SKC80235.1 hypothetical protein SAMN06296058_3247 [Pseudoxanthomonas indica]
MPNPKATLLAATLTCAAAMTACAATPDSSLADELPGCYRASDATRYQAMQVELKADHTYYAEHQGHMGLWESGIGVWRQDGNKIDFSRDQVDDKSSLPSRLKIKHGPEGVTLHIPNGGILWEEPLTIRSCDGVGWQGTALNRKGAPPAIPAGEYTFQHRFAEHPSMPSVDMRVRFADGHITVTNTRPGTPFPLGVVAEGQLRWNGNVGRWIVARTPADVEATEVGACTEGPEVVDLEQRIYWTC